jgi:hypothetical protein
LNDFIDFVLSVLVEFAANRTAAVWEVVAITVAGVFLVFAFVHPLVRTKAAGAAIPAFRLLQVFVGMLRKHPANLAAAAAAVGFQVVASVMIIKIIVLVK